MSDGREGRKVVETKIINGEPMTEEECFVSNQKLIWYVLKRYFPIMRKLGIENDDLYSEGTLGLIHAYRKFDESMGNSFSTYAIPSINGYIQRYMRDKTKVVKYGRKILSIATNIYKEGLGELTAEEIANKLGISEKDVQYAILSQKEIKSTDELVYRNEGEDTSFGDFLGREEDFTGAIVEDFINRLPEREQIIIRMKLRGSVQTEIGDYLGISQVQVSRHLKNIGNKYLEYSEGNQMAKGDLGKAKQLLRDTDMKVSQIAKETGTLEGTVYYHSKKIRGENKVNTKTATIARAKHDELENKYYELLNDYEKVKKELKEMKGFRKVEQQGEDWKSKYLQEKQAHEHLYKYVSLIKGA